MALKERSFSDILQDIVRHVQEIVRSELRLATLELRQEVGKAKRSATLIGAGAVSGVLGAVFLLLAAAMALAQVIPGWAAALIVGMSVATLAGVLLHKGVSGFRRIHPAPQRTVETIKETLKWAKHQVK